MSDDKKQDGRKPLTLGKTLGLKKADGEKKVRQSFSHGRSKSVVVEVRKKRASSIKPSDKATLNESELKARLEAFKKSMNKDGEKKKEDSILTQFGASANQPQEQPKEEEPKAEEKASEETVAPSAEAQPAAQPAHKKKSLPPKRTAVEEEEENAKKKADKKPNAFMRSTLSNQRRQNNKLQVHKVATSEEELDNASSKAARRKTKNRSRANLKQNYEESQKIVRTVAIPDVISVQELSNRMSVRSAEVIKKLMQLGVMVNITQNIDADTAELVVTELGHTPERVKNPDIAEDLLNDRDDPESLVARAPVVTVMGHVDHGKTSLLDALRETDVVGGEAGGITQHIGAYQVTLSNNKKISFIDTPGHAAFSDMRARGANVTDIVILVVAADDGIKEQTIEAINHAKAAKVPIIIAINKIDKPEADAQRVRNELLSHDVILEEFGGEIMSVEVSAKKRIGLDKLEETVLLQAEMLELKANPDRKAQGTVIEAKLEKGRGAVATVLIERGTLNVSDVFVAGTEQGRVRAMIDSHGKKLKKAGPALPVEIVGFTGAPVAGDKFLVVKDEGEARDITEFRAQKQKDELNLARAETKRANLFQQNDNNQKVLAVIIKGDVQGSVEAIKTSLEKLQNEEVSVNILHTGVGGITESDISLANASNAFVIGFNVRATAQAKTIAKRDEIDIRYYSIIYNVIDDVKAILSGLLDPTLKEEFLGYAEVRQVFSVPKVGKVAGCMVTSGLLKRGSRVRLLRDNVVIFDGELDTLKRYKDEVKEAREGYECGLSFKNYNDIKEGDVVECYEVIEVAREL